jgi:hypothetical protein
MNVTAGNRAAIAAEARILALARYRAMMPLMFALPLEHVARKAIASP